MDGILIFRALSILAVLAGFGLVVWRLRRKPPLTKARTVGLAVAQKYLKQAVLLDDYTHDEERRSELIRAIDHGEIAAYTWSGYVFIEPPSKEGGSITRSG